MKKFLSIVFLILICLLIGGLNINRVSAAKCPVSEEVNDSINTACNMKDRGMAIGTLWISNDSSTTSISSEVRTSQSSGRITVYLHGAVFYSKHDAAAKDIMFIKDDSVDQINNTSSGYSDYLPLQIIDRKFTRKSVYDPFNDTIESYIKPITLDLDKLADVEPHYEEKNGRRIYRITLHAFRCYDSDNVTQPSPSCWSSKSTFVVNMPMPFQGKTEVSSSGMSSSTNYQYVNSEAEMLFIDNCPTSGCDFKFSHSIRRDSGDESTNYTIIRESDFGKREQLQKGKFKARVSGMVFEDMVRIPLGQVVCEELIFSPKGNSSMVTTRVCAAAGGTIDMNAGAELNLDVKNDFAADDYKSYGDEVYAKPGDKVVFKANYDPAPQFAYNIRVQKMAFNGGDKLYPENGISGATLGSLFNSSRGDRFANWNNAFSVLYKDNVWHKNYNLGETTRQEEYYPNNDIKASDVGKRIEAIAQTNYNNDSRVSTTPSQVKFEKYDGLTNEKALVFGSVLANSFVMDISGGAENASENTNVQLYTKNGSKAQEWKLVKYLGTNYYRIINYVKGRVDKNGNSMENLALDIKGGVSNSTGKIKEGTNVQVYKVNNSCAQLWEIKRNGDGSYTFLSSCPGEGGNKMVLDVAGGFAANGTNLRVWRLNGTASQRWNIIRTQYSLARVQTTYIRDNAFVVVPYNFENTTQIDSDKATLFAGEEVDIKYYIRVGGKWNEVTNGNYATKVPNATYGVTYSYIDENGQKISRDFSVDKKTLNEQNKLDEVIDTTTTISVPDLPAGTTMCLTSWIWPAKSGSDKNISLDGFPSDRAESSPVCLPVAKRPSIQVWGGNVYSNGNINTSVSGKSQLAGYNGDANIHYFGSFGE
ncbi:RICIN domain-containing protein, partial [Candidatus Saccharibacteria bacterium]|nr:RICIN domain-containing protein [Candidatus Saccharibacteria bacterium]